LKIKIWAFVLIIVGSLVLGGALSFAVTGGLTAAGKVLQYMHPQAAASVQAPNSNSGNGAGNGYGSYGRASGMMPGNGQFYTLPAKPAGLPQDFNAGVNIESEYAALTSRTVAQLQSAEQAANTDVWSLAQSEGKLDQLKTKVTDDVTASLKQIVTSGKLTQAQSDSYLTWVKQYLDAVSQASSAGSQPDYRGGMMPGYGRRGDGNRQQPPSSSAAPEATPAPTATGSGV